MASIPTVERNHVGLTVVRASIKISHREPLLVTTIALLTDFGTQDAYVGIMKGVIANINPQARVVDITHAIPPGDIRRAAFELWRAAPYFPQGTIFLTVVDPGVGGTRLPIAISWPGRICVGPDNGLFTYLLTQEQAVSAIALTEKEYLLDTISETFHGRDVFAPSAAHLSLGVHLPLLGPPLEDPIRLPLPRLQVIEGETIHGEILHADRFGNLITSIGILRKEANELVIHPWLPDCPSLRLPHDKVQVSLPGMEHLSLSRTYGDVPEGELAAYIGSAGLLEIAVNKGSAEYQLAISSGQEIQLGLRG
ncbi:MAG: hypothetical protein GTO14_11950 [Anaerolineales bacterium]|nr:hypothetical protein [Anaerolineales bacterium]